MRPLSEVSNLINCLSNDDDVRQDLWVCYLAGTPADSLESHLSKIKAEYSDDLDLQKSLWRLVYEPTPGELYVFVQANFTEYERSIICFLMLGLNVSRISEIKGISQVRIRQSIASIRYNEVWNRYQTEVYHRTKERL